MARCAWRVRIDPGDMSRSDYGSRYRRPFARNGEHRMRTLARGLREQPQSADKRGGAAGAAEMCARNFIFGVA